MVVVGGAVVVVDVVVVDVEVVEIVVVVVVVSTTVAFIVDVTIETIEYLKLKPLTPTI